MKKILIILFALTSFGMNSANAQFLNKLKKQILEKTEEKVINKTTDKAAEGTDKAMDKLLNQDFSKYMNPLGKTVDVSTLPASYQFDYLYSLKMKVAEGDMKINYYLNKKQPYMGIKMDEVNDMTIVYDESNKVIFTNVGGMAIATELNLDEVDDDDDIDITQNYSFKELPNRTFLGYDCIGREIENDEHKVTVYIAPNVESGFGKMFKSDHAKMPSAMKRFSKEFKEGLMMYMEMIDKKNVNTKKNSSATVECVAFEPTDFVVTTR